MKPTFVFLHGLLGTAADWQKVIEKLPHFNCISLDLPFHGKAKEVEIADFEQCCAYLALQIQTAVQNKPYFLVGYSLGGRLALYYALQFCEYKGNLQGLILEGANLGLTNEQDRQQRLQNDQQWATRFCTEPADKVLMDWYQQPVFAHLTTSQRQDLMQQRRVNCGENIAKMLMATSLAKQPDFRGKVRSNFFPIFYLAGEQDHKFSQMAQAEGLNCRLITQAGHNAHLENPEAFAQQLSQIIGINSPKE